MERPILFSGPMVRAILEGRKTQTRRVVRWRPSSPADVSATRPPDEAQPYTHIDGAWLAMWREPTGTSHMPTVCPYGVPGDTLWVRETWRLDARRGAIGLGYRADGDGDAPTLKEIPRSVLGVGDLAERHGWIYVDGWGWQWPSHTAPVPWRPSIHMPRWASRLTLRVESVRVERVQEISEADARAEGVAPVMMDHGSWLPGFEGLWDRINGARAPWASNPWVWVVSFERIGSAP